MCALGFAPEAHIGFSPIETRVWNLTTRFLMSHTLCCLGLRLALSWTAIVQEGNRLGLGTG